MHTLLRKWGSADVPRVGVVPAQAGYGQPYASLASTTLRSSG